MKRRPRPSLVTTTMPALASLLAHCSREPARFAPNPPPPPREPLTQAVDAGAAEPLPPQRVDLNNLPPIPLAGAPMPVTPMPRPAPMPAPAPHAAMAPSAAAPMAAPAMAAAPAPSMVTIVHNHPPGTPCRPLSQTELRQAAQQQAAGGS